MSISAANFTSRPPAAAGHFYDADPHLLRAEVGRLLANAPRPTTSGPPKAVIPPHAGYLYSGQVAAAALVSFERWAEAIQRVVLIGPAHYVRFRGLAIPTVGIFDTPIGPVALDRDALAAIATTASVKSTDAPHTPEHALEVELPFLQMLLPGFKAVPLLVGDATPEEVADVLSRLWGGPETVIVVSSDLSHFHDYETAQHRDRATAERIERGAWAGLGPRDACGYLAIAGLLLESTRRGLKDFIVQLRGHCRAG